MGTIRSRFAQRIQLFPINYLPQQQTGAVADVKAEERIAAARAAHSNRMQFQEQR